MNSTVSFIRNVLIIRDSVVCGIVLNFGLFRMHCIEKDNECTVNCDRLSVVMCLHKPRCHPLVNETRQLSSLIILLVWLAA